MKGNILKSYIVEKNYTIREISNLININEMTLSNWINNRNTNQIDNFLMLLILLELNTEQIKKLK